MDRVFARALKNGVILIMPLTDMFWGDRVGVLKDPFGHFWIVATHKKDVTMEELKEGAEQFLKQQ